MTTDALALDPDLEFPFDPASPLRPSGNLARRRWVNAFAQTAAMGAAVLAIAVLAIVTVGVISRGADALSIDFLTKAPPAFGGPGGGIAPAIIGTALLVGFATLLSMPLGVLVALFVTEFARPRTARTIRLILDMMNGLPSIVIGLFVFGLLVAGKHQSGFAGSVGLAIIMLPLIARATEEMLLLVPPTQREAADALGVSRWRTVVGVIVPTALPGIVTGTLLALARAAGETAPLIFVSSIYKDQVSFDFFGHALPNIPVSIFTLSEQPDPSGLTRAWGAAFVLLMFILLVNVGARAALARSRSRMTR